MSLMLEINKIFLAKVTEMQKLIQLQPNRSSQDLLSHTPMLACEIRSSKCDWEFFSIQCSVSHERGNESVL